MFCPPFSFSSFRASVLNFFRFPLAPLELLLDSSIFTLSSNRHICYVPSKGQYPGIVHRLNFRMWSINISCLSRRILSWICLDRLAHRSISFGLYYCNSGYIDYSQGLICCTCFVKYLHLYFWAPYRFVQYHFHYLHQRKYSTSLSTKRQSKRYLSVSCPYLGKSWDSIFILPCFLWHWHRSKDPGARTWSLQLCRFRQSHWNRFTSWNWHPCF